MPHKSEPEPYLNPEITIGNDKITARYCRGFGTKILTDRDQVLIRGGNSIYIYKVFGSKIELIQTITIDFNLSTSFITAMTVNNSTLAFGTTEEGKNVFIYERVGDSWVFKQEISGTTEEALGVSIDIDGNYMIIGAPAVRSFVSGTKNGKVYIYHKTSKGWIQVQVLLAPEPSSGDEFGSNIAIYNNLLISGFKLLTYIPIKMLL